MLIKKNTLLLIPLLMFCGHSFAQQVQKVSAVSTVNDKKLNGVIKDAATGKVLAGARVSYGNTSAAIADTSGKFELKVPDYNVTVIVTAEGYQDKEVALKGRQIITASLYDNNFLSYYDDIKMPFNTVTQTNVAAVANTVQTKGSWNNPIETPDAYLQGRVAGLNVIRRSGTPNTGGNLFLRGFSSLYATSKPLVVVDGVIFDGEASGASLNTGYYNNPFSFIDIKDIDNITVIKDGLSTYGTRGANGVILITTARAKQEATAIDVAVYGGINTPPSQLPVMDVKDYRIFLAEMLQSKGLSYSEVKNLPYINDDVANPDYYRYHNNLDWQKKVFRNAAMQNVYLKITGGDNVARYGLTMGFANNNGTISNTKASKYNMRFNGDFTLSTCFTASANLSFTYNEQKSKNFGISPGTNPIQTALVKAPFLNDYEMADNGVISPVLAGRDTFNVSNPSALIQNMQASNTNYRFVGAVHFNYKLSSYFTLASSIAVTIDKIRESFFVPELGVVSDTLDNALATNRSGSQVLRMFTLYNDTRLSYNRTFARVHQLGVNVGMRYAKTNTEQDFGLGYNSATDQLTSVSFGLNSLRRIGGSLGESRWLNYYVNADYSLRGKYFLSLNLAVDGSSKFGEGTVNKGVKLGTKNYAVLPSLSASWIVSSEKFMANNGWLDLFKLRASVGMVGNEDIGNYTARKYYTPQNLLGMQGVVRGNAGNPNLQWETITKLNFGADLAFFNERLRVSGDVFQNTTTNMIIYQPAATASGFDYVVNNSGAMKTTGVEATINVRAVNHSNFKWDIGLNIAHSKSKITELPVDRILTEFADGTILTQVGLAPNVFYGYKTNGVYTTGAAASAEGLSVKNANTSFSAFKGGDVRFTNLNSSDKIIDDKDRAVIGNPNPDFYGAFLNTIAWKKWRLDAVVSFSQGNDVYNYARRKLESMEGYGNQTQAVISRWKKDGQVTNTPKATWGDPMGNSRFSDRWIEDGSYIRLRTISLSYNFALKAGAIKSLVVYANANNLITLTKYLGYDPEFSATSGALGQGVDVMLEPQFKSVQAGLKIGL